MPWQHDTPWAHGITTKDTELLRLRAWRGFFAMHFHPPTSPPCQPLLLLSAHVVGPWHGKRRSDQLTTEREWVVGVVRVRVGGPAGGWVSAEGWEARRHVAHSAGTTTS